MWLLESQTWLNFGQTIKNCDVIPWARPIFVGMTFDSAIRLFLESFRLPGEAQKINRIVESFGTYYHKQCPKLFKNADAVYIFAYSVILLNTDQHNSQVQSLSASISCVVLLNFWHASNLLDKYVPTFYLWGLESSCPVQFVTQMGPSCFFKQRVCSFDLILNRQLTPEPADRYEAERSRVRRWHSISQASWQ